MSNSNSLPRRAFLSGAAMASGGAAARVPRALHVPGGKVINAHEHLSHHSRSGWEASDRKMVDDSERLGIDQLCCSILPPWRPATAESFRQCNEWMAEGMRRFPGRVLGYCFVNPGYTREALEEIRRCVEDRGFIGIKLYNDYRADEPVLFPIVELAIRLRVPILHHGGHLHWPNPAQPRISDGGHMAELARRYPEAMLICAHVAGGGDWEWTIKALRNARGVYLDTSGSVTDAGVVEMAVSVLGARRLLFACDSSLTASVGRIRGAAIPEPDRQRILGTNMAGILARRNG